MGYQSFQHPPIQQTINPSTKRTKLCHHTQTPPIEAYITATELAAAKLPNQEAEEFRSDVNRLLKQQQQQHHQHCNLTPAQCTGPSPNLNKTTIGSYSQLTRGWPWWSWTFRTIITRHRLFFKTPNTYKVLPKDPTPQLKNKLITLLKNIHQTGGLNTHKYKQLYPTSAIPPKFYGLPKIHKTGTPSGP